MWNDFVKAMPGVRPACFSIDGVGNTRLAVSAANSSAFPTSLPHASKALPCRLLPRSSFNPNPARQAHRPGAAPRRRPIAAHLGRGTAPPPFSLFRLSFLTLPVKSRRVGFRVAGASAGELASSSSLSLQIPPLCPARSLQGFPPQPLLRRAFAAFALKRSGPNGGRDPNLRAFGLKASLVFQDWRRDLDGNEVPPSPRAKLFPLEPRRRRASPKGHRHCFFWGGG